MAGLLSGVFPGSDARLRNAVKRAVAEMADAELAVQEAVAAERERIGARLAAWLVPARSQEDIAAVLGHGQLPPPARLAQAPPADEAPHAPRRHYVVAGGAIMTERLLAQTPHRPRRPRASDCWICLDCGTPLQRRSESRPWESAVTGSTVCAGPS